MIQQILNKLNENREIDNTIFTIENTPDSLIAFWQKYMIDNERNA